MIRKKGNILKYHNAFTTVFVLFALVSSVPADAEDSADWFPLAVGNSWLYEMESFSFADNDTTFNTGTRLCEITDLLTHEAGFPIYEMRTIRASDAAESSADTTFDYLRNTATELRGYTSTSLDMYDVWISFGMMNSEMAMLMETSAPMGIRLEPLVVLPAGDFSNCSVIVYPAGYNGSGTYDSYFHRGTGLIKTVYSVESYHMAESLIDSNIQQR
ncbi:MAG: hypothetical protein KAS73_00235 [Candidatus Sabulitectum sp.]|nr:hypothetical protein [Candidatus Sabulitectum sp.]